VNDPILEALLRAADEECAEREIERLLENPVRPVTEKILARHSLSREDAEDVTATVHLRLIAKLRAIRSIADEAIESLESYVATATYNLINDHWRRRFPERARLKSRLRYLLLRDARFAVWPAAGESACGLRAWKGREAAGEIDVPEQRQGSAIGNPSRPAEALEGLFRLVRQPVLLDGLVAFFAERWNISDAPPRPVAVEPAAVSDAASRTEARDLLRALWPEIRELPPMQRKALLLNLRDNATVNVTSLLVMTGTASYDDLAETLGMKPEELAAIWNDLPLDDLRIASLLDVTRQQVINLRKAARARLSRRLRNVRNIGGGSTS